MMAGLIETCGVRKKSEQIQGVSDGIHSLIYVKHVDLTCSVQKGDVLTACVGVFLHHYTS
jgi:hypothetical protein